MKQVLTVLFFNLYYLYCLSIFQRTCCFRFKSGCKGKRFIFNCQIFSEVFFIFFFNSFLRLSCERERIIIKEKSKTVFFANRTAKIRTFRFIFQTFSEVFFVLMFKPSYALSLSHFVKAFFSRKAGAKVLRFGIHSKYITLFFLIIFVCLC